MLKERSCDHEELRSAELESGGYYPAYFIDRFQFLEKTRLVVLR